MKKCSKKDAAQHKNSDNCIIYEFSTDSDLINFAISKITARYPETGLATNTECSEIVYIQDGQGKIVINEIEYNLEAGDVILISPNERYYWDGEMTLHISCTPAFKPEQHLHLP